jgi:hypothetical protein
MMRSMANHKPISPFHLMAADEMEQLLEEVLKYRKEKEMKDDDDIQDYVSDKNVNDIRNQVLEEVAHEFDCMRIAFGDTAASFAQYVREMKYAKTKAP